MDDLVVVPRRTALQAKFFENLNHHLRSKAIKPAAAKKIRQFCLVDENRQLPSGYTQGEISATLGVDQSLVSRTTKIAKTALSPLGKSKRKRRNDAFEIQHPELVVLIKDFWVRVACFLC